MSKDDFKSLNISTFQHGSGVAILNSFVLPVLERSVTYDRLTGYFNVSGLVGIASGLERLFRNGGKMRLVIGLHDVPGDLLASLAIGEILPQILIEQYRSRLLDEIGFLRTEAEKSGLIAVAWLIRLGYLNVVIAAPRSARGIFHQKRMIFRDGVGNVIAGTGSLNETGGGHNNVEEMNFHFSWTSTQESWQPFVDDFERIWNNQSEDLHVRRLDSEFASEILSILGDSANPYSQGNIRTGAINESQTLSLLSEFIRNSTSLAALNSSKAVLYPHQERVFRETLNSYPVRKILGDEVGLGKTLEAGAIISHLIRTGTVREVLLLTPAGLINQWQQEMLMHFDLKFSKWNSQSRCFVDESDANVSGLSGRRSDNPLRIMSAQWARLNPEFVNSLNVDLLVVDEAHAARIHKDAYGIRRTELWKLLSEMGKRVPNVVLLTATPMQVDPIEFHGLLQILGLNEFWSDYRNYEHSLELLTSDVGKPTMQDSFELFKMVASSFEFEDKHLIDGQEEGGVLAKIIELCGESQASQAIFVQKNYKTTLKILAMLHPGHRLIVRNTKTGLERFGYRFPERSFESPAVSLSGPLEHFERMVEAYLKDSFGRVEEAVAGDSRGQMRFAKSSYYQRLVSSLTAAETSLRRRHERLAEIQSLAAQGDISILSKAPSSIDPDDDEIELDDEVDFASPPSGEIQGRLNAVIAAANIEIAYIRDLLNRLGKLNGSVASNDPKFQVALKIINELLPTKQILVFSKYTNTIEAFVEYVIGENRDIDSTGIALYTGQAVWIQKFGVQRASSKFEVTRSLSNNEIRVVFCSDAASEGLNLQSAQVIINLDVPWNPARLEQRIGRIARLGQRAKVVEIFNLWYPRSIEAKMYRRLLERRSDYQIAVGEFPEIFSNAIKREVALAMGDPTHASIDAPALLSEVRNSVQRRALEALWSNSPFQVSLSSNMRRALIEVLSPDKFNFPDIQTYSSEPGHDKSLSLQSGPVDAVRNVEAAKPTENALDLNIIAVHSNSVALGVRLKGNMVALLNPISLPDVLSSIIHGTQLSQSCFDQVPLGKLSKLVVDGIGPWQAGAGVICFSGKTVDLADLIFIPIGKIELEGLVASDAN